MHRTPDPQPEDELARVREVLERTKRFLARCAEDPQAAIEAEDPRDLIRGLESLAVQPVSPEQDEQAAPAKEPRTIQIRRRRSA